MADSDKPDRTVAAAEPDGGRTGDDVSARDAARTTLKTAAREARAERLAAQLKANLKRRKAQARTRSAAGADDAQ